jgi:hypothetical protein
LKGRFEGACSQGAGWRGSFPTFSPSERWRPRAGGVNDDDEEGGGGGGDGGGGGGAEERKKRHTGGVGRRGGGGKSAPSVAGYEEAQAV